MSFKMLEKDKVTIIKQNGKIFENILANVQSGKIFISDKNIPLEDGDKITRKLPSGVIESYLVKNAGFYHGSFGLPGGYQAVVQKEPINNPLLKEVTINKEMHQEKKYQIFISSTYTDLKRERQKVIDTILMSENIPIGMEMFVGQNVEQWEIIKRTIDSSDYYVLIVAHKYGSMDESGISYTEKEFDYAKSINIPVYCFIIDDSIAWSKDKEDSDQNAKSKLKNLKEKLQKNYVKYWKNEYDLARLVNLALNDGYKNYPRPGWVRNISKILEDTLTENREKLSTSVEVPNQDQIINAFDKLKATNLHPITFQQIHDETLISKQELLEELEFMRGRHIIFEMGMGFGDDRLFYR